MTYSIVARDAETGSLGVGVQSGFFSAGRVVPWIEAGVGAIASQALSDGSYGVLGLDLLRAAKPASEVLAALLLLDPSRETRQVGIVDAAGRSAAHTGQMCVPEAGQHTGDGFTVQANMMQRPTVPAAMADAFQASAAAFPERLVQALRAAENEGGDFRGQQSAALVVVDSRPRQPWESRVVDIRVDDHHDALGELTHLLELERGYRALERAIGCLEGLDLDGAARELDEAQRVLPTVIEPTLMRIGLLLVANNTDQARNTIEAFAGDQVRLATALRRSAAAGLLPLDSRTIEALLTDIA
ncbi:MAG TPA: DUF1028 domain-containing protein [Acidimicrobiia bacterium]|jgi:uncharacterized Ntn-hydrolase superfamily protein|nr:DUF1028 domain-containing protein [Acidimicrobiia bacterium]